MFVDRKHLSSRFPPSEFVRTNRKKAGWRRQTLTKSPPNSILFLIVRVENGLYRQELTGPKSKISLYTFKCKFIPGPRSSLNAAYCLLCAHVYRYIVSWPNFIVSSGTVPSYRNRVQKVSRF